MIQDQQLHIYDKNLISSYVKNSKFIQDARGTEGVSFETNDEDGDCLYLDIEEDSDSDLFYIAEITQNNKNCFLLAVNNSRFNIGIVTETLNEAIVRGKIWACDKSTIALLKSMAPTDSEVAQMIANAAHGRYAVSPKPPKKSN